MYLGTTQEHTVYEAEGVGLLMGLHLLNGLSRHPTVDSQAVIKALKSQSSHPGQYLLDAIHSAAEGLNAKQDGLINNDARRLAIADGDRWTGKTRGIIDLQLHWVPCWIIVLVRAPCARALAQGYFRLALLFNCCKWLYRIRYISSYPAWLFDHFKVNDFGNP